MPSEQQRLAAAIALTRFGLGARPGELDRVGDDARGWLMAQIRPGDGAALPARRLQASGPRLAAYARERDREARSEFRRDTDRAFADRVKLAAGTEDGFAERWALFWANWFTVSAINGRVRAVTPQFEAEAIRPHVFGRFEALLVAAEQHPAMLHYLDQARSVGPNSPAGERREAGLNENLAREIMELHTVGPDAGYGQADVTEFARALTGWTVDSRPGESDGEGPYGFVFRNAQHEPGARTVLGETFAQRGEQQGLAVLSMLAAHPATRRRACARIAAHFTADSPPPTLVAKLETAWRNSDGDLAQVARALVAARETWTPQAAKLKSPYEFVVSAWRAMGQTPERANQVVPVLRSMGQTPFRPPSPEGWPDDAQTWAAPSAVVRRMIWAEAFAEAAPPSLEPADLARDVLGPRLRGESFQAIQRAETRTEALALLLMCPEFMRR